MTRLFLSSEGGATHRKCPLSSAPPGCEVAGRLYLGAIVALVGWTLPVASWVSQVLAFAVSTPAVYKPRSSKFSLAVLKE